MAGPTASAASFRKALARLTGDPGRRGSHVVVYRIAVTTSDGEPYGLRLSAGNNAPDPPKSNIGQLKRRLGFTDNGIDIDDVLSNWGPDELAAYVRENLSRTQLDERKGG